MVAIVANCENSSESDKLLLNERDSEADEVSEVRLVGEIGDEVNEVDYDEVR